MATERQARARGWRTAVWGSLLIGGLLGGWLGGPAEAQGPYTAQITRALRALGLTSGGSPTFGTVTATKVLAGDGSAAAPSIARSAGTSTGLFFNGNDLVYTSSGARSINFNTTGIGIPAAGSFSWSSSSDVFASADLFILRDGADTLGLRRGTNAQAFNIYNTFTDVTHYEDLRIFWSANVANIVTDFSNESARALVIGTVGANSLQLKTNNLVRWLVDSSGNLVANSDNSVDFGASGANRARNAYIGTSVVTPVFRSAQTTAPTCTSNCGTSPAVVGGDSGGIVTMGATGSPASGWVLTFNGTWAAAPSCTVQMAKAGMVVGKMPLTVVTSTTTVTVVTNGTAPANSDQYAYHCIGVQ